jgi:hypothetical protein
VAGTVEGMHPGIPHLRNPEYSNLDPVWKETDEGGKDYPGNDFGKGRVGTYQVVSFFLKERSMRRQSYGPWFFWSGERSMTPRHKARLGNRPFILAKKPPSNARVLQCYQLV